MDSVVCKAKTHRVSVADIVNIKLFVGGLQNFFFNALVKSTEKIKYQGH